MSTLRMTSGNGRLKAGTEVHFNGSVYYIEHDSENGFVSLRDNKAGTPFDVTFTISKSEITIAPKYRTTLKVVAKKETPAKKKEKNANTVFFDSIAHKIPFNCTNCRKPLYALTKFAQRSVCSHILPKEIFKTIATNEYNIYFLGADFLGNTCDCHDRWGKDVKSRMHPDMKRVYDLSIKRYYEHLKAEIPEDQIIAAEEYLGIRKKSLNMAQDIAEGRIV